MPKIRCSGYQNTQNGKCTNCDKLRIDCVFQPVSSNAGTAFIPVSAVPGGVPPGTPLYGAYGQPLPPAGPPNGSPQYPGPPPPSGGGPAVDYRHPVASPTSQYPPPHDDRVDYGRRRPHEEDHPMRLPPPHPYQQEEDPRRRSPASTQSGSTPPTGYHQYQQSHYDDRMSMPQRNSPGGPPSQQGQGQPPAPGSGNPMSLDNMMGPAQRHDSSHDIDSNMLGRLNRRS
jgi:hypothetical protein